MEEPIKQVSFASVVYHDKEMPADTKYRWLKTAAKELTGEHQKEAQEYLERFTAELDNEFQR